MYDANAPKRPVNMTLNEDLVRRVREYATNLSEQVEKLLADYLSTEQARRAEQEGRLDRALAAWNEFDETYGSFADDHTDL